MTALSLSAIVLTLLGTVPGDTTGWGTGAVDFQAYVSTSEHQEIYPIGAGQYTVEVAIAQIVDDPAGVLDNITSVDVCYNTKMNLVVGSLVEVTGTYYDAPVPSLTAAAWRFPRSTKSASCNSRRSKRNSRISRRPAC